MNAGAVSTSTGSVYVALWGTVTAPVALICHEAGAILCVYTLVGNLPTYATEEFCARGLSDLREARHGKTYCDYPIGTLRQTGGRRVARSQALGQGAVPRLHRHKDPKIHLKMLAHDFPFDACQLPLNVFDGTYRSFEQEVLPVLT